MADRAWFAAPPARRRRDHAHRPHRRRVDHRRLGAPGARHRLLADRRRRLRRRVRVPHLPRGHAVRQGGRDLRVLASRISYVGELGWELYVPMDTAAELWEALLEAGAPHGAVPAGIGVYGTTGRIEKGYRAYGAELDSERTIVEAGHAAPQGQGGRLRRQGGLPRAAGRARPGEAASVLCTLTVDDHTSASRHEALHARRRADPDPRRRHAHRRARAPPLRHLGGLGALARQARPARLPAARAGGDRQPSWPCPTWRSSTR